MATRDTREILLRRPDVPDEDVDDIIARAAELQESDRKHDDGHATVAEVEAVAAELDIDPSYVERAIGAIKSERDAEDADARALAERRSRTLLYGGIGIVGAGLLSLFGVGSAAAVGAARIGPAALEVDQTGARLEAALDRQSALAPQLVALAGGNSAPVRVAADAAKSATTIDTRLETAEALNQAMADAIGQITADGDDQAQQRLLNLQYEVVGTWNRIDTERGRYDEARARYDRVAGSTTGSLALRTGLAQPPGVDE